MMQTLQTELLSLGFRTIFVAEDRTENFTSACGLATLLPDIDFTFFSSAKDVLGALAKSGTAVDLVVTDNNMESPNVGIRVMEEAWWSLIPAVIASGGFRHANVDNVILTPFIEEPSLVKGEKSDTATWVQILQRIIASSEFRCMRGSILRYRTIATEMPLEEWLRQVPRQAAEFALRERQHR